MEQYLVLVVPTFLKCINLQISHNFFPLILTIEISGGYKPSAGFFCWAKFILICQISGADPIHFFVQKTICVKGNLHLSHILLPEKCSWTL
jgi:hypothetical protein